MKTVLRRATLTLILLLLSTATAPLHADHGEYTPPGPMPPLTPAGSSPGAAGRPMGDPTQAKRTGPLTPGSLTPGTTSARPDTVGQQAAIPWEAVFDVVRWGLPDRVPGAARGVRNVAREALGGRLEDKSLEVRRYVVLALGRLGEFDRAIEAIGKDPVVSRGVGLLGPGLALRSPAFQGDSAAMRETLLPIVANEGRSQLDRALAAISLALAGPGEASGLLEVMQNTAPGRLRDVFLFALGLTGHPGARELLLDRVLPPKDKDAADDPDLRALLLTSLSRVPGPEVTGDLYRRLTDPSTRVQAAAALCLAGRKSNVIGGAAALHKLAIQGRARPRSAALLSLGLSGDPKAVALCRRAMADLACRDNGTAALAAFVLGLVGSAEDGPGLVATFADRGAPEELRKASAVAAGLVRARDSTAVMVKAIKKAKDPLVASFGIVGLSLIDGAAALPLIRGVLAVSKDDPVRRLMVIALGFTGGGEAEKLLVKAYSDNYLVNREAPPALFRLNPELAVEEVLKRLEDERDHWTRRFAAIALARCFEPDSPSFFGSILLGTGLDGGTSVEKLLLYLESGS